MRRLPKAALSLPLVLRSRIRGCLPLQVGDGIGTAAGKRHNVIFDVAGAGRTQETGLVAELNAAFLSAVLGPTPSFREEHAAYIAGLHGFSSGSPSHYLNGKENGPLPSSRSDPSLPLKGNGRAHVTPVAVEQDAACIKQT